MSMSGFADALAGLGTEMGLLSLSMYGGAAGLILIGLYGMIAERHLARIVLALALVGSGVNLLIVAVGFRPDAAAPILTGDMKPVAMVDPIPQALVLTSIVIDVGVLALALALMIRVHEAFGTLDAREVQKRIAEATNGGRHEPEHADSRPERSTGRSQRQIVKSREEVA
jgi:multisubunit Na+/H+ antiporter MnhC subunit